LKKMQFEFDAWFTSPGSPPPIKLTATI
jgi:hypothetical protein